MLTFLNFKEFITKINSLAYRKNYKNPFKKKILKKNSNIQIDYLKQKKICIYSLGTHLKKLTY